MCIIHTCIIHVYHIYLVLVSHLTAASDTRESGSLGGLDARQDMIPSLTLGQGDSDLSISVILEGGSSEIPSRSA